MKTDIIVFLGPSLDLKQAKKILPDAMYLNPVQCGDIFKVCLLKPRCILIIDGLFEQTGAVWHKEIMFALESGVNVFGASSMGALRAAELFDYGMRGIGKIFEMVHSTEVVGDDEVSLPHLCGKGNFQSTITPLVNVRVTLKKAVDEKIIDSELAKRLIDDLKSKPYFKRRLFQLAKKHEKLLAWLEKNYIDQKELDAITALTEVAKQNFSNKANNLPYSYPFFIKRIYREIVSAPLKLSSGVDTSQNLSEIEIQVLQDYAKLMQMEHEITAHDATVFASIGLDSYPHKVADVIVDYKAYHAVEVVMSAAFEKILEKLLSLYVRIAAYLLRADNELNSELMQEFFNNFRKGCGLMTVEKTQEWIKKVGLKDNDGVQRFAASMFMFNYLSELNRFDVFSIPIKMDRIHWFDRAYKIMKGD